MSNKRNIHVVPHPDGGWATRRAGADRVSDRHRTQGDAIDAAKPRAKSDQVELIIHRPDGRIRDSDSYGNDPFPPRDKKH